MIFHIYIYINHYKSLYIPKKIQIESQNTQRYPKYPKVISPILKLHASIYIYIYIPFQTNVAPHQTSHLLDLHVSSCRSCSEPSRLFQGPRNTKEIKGIIKRYKEIVSSHVISFSRLSRKWCGISAYIYIRTIHNQL